MSVKPSGCAVRAHQWSFYCRSILLMLLTLAVFHLSAAHAAEEKTAPSSSPPQKTILQKASYKHPAEKPKHQVRAGYAPSAQAMALVLALGLRDVPGPVENRAAVKRQD